MIFNEQSLKGMQATGKRYVVSDESRPGFAIKVSALGSAGFYYRFKKHGERQEVDLGTDFHKALALYLQLVDTTSRGGDVTTDPVQVDLNSLFYPDITLTKLIQAYFKEYVVKELSRPSQRNYEAFLGELEQWAVSKAKPLYYGQCTLMEGREFIRKFLLAKVTDTPILCNRMRSVYSSMFKWGSRERELVRGNPVYNMPAGIEKPKTRMLSNDELQVWLPVLQSGDYAEQTKDALRFMLLTMLRPGEVLQLRKSFVSPSLLEDDKGENLILPGNVTKNGRPHLVPLSAEAQAILDKYADAKPGDRLFKLSTWGLRQVCMRACKKSGVTVCSPHDLRRTSATISGEIGTPQTLIPLLLNHTPTSVTDKHYALYGFAREKREWLQKLASRLVTLGLIP